jgi:AcrR family transcriptional regulator
VSPRGVPDKRAAIMRAAIQLFGRGQFHGTTIPALAKAAGVAEGTIYNYFQSKEDLAFKTLAESSEGIEQDLVNSVPQQADPLEQLSYAANLMLQVAEEDIERARYVLCVDHDAYLGPRAAEASAIPSLIEFMVANATARAETKALSPNVLVALWLGVIRGAVASRASGALEQPLGGVADQVARAAVDAIRA